MVATTFWHTWKKNQTSQKHPKMYVYVGWTGCFLRTLYIEALMNNSRRTSIYKVLGQQFGPFINLTMKKQSDIVFNHIHQTIRIVRASDSQCQSHSSPGFNPSILRRSGIWEAADEAALNKAQPTMEVLSVTSQLFLAASTSQQWLESLIWQLLRLHIYAAAPEPIFLNVYGAQESIPRNEFRQPM